MFSLKLGKKKPIIRVFDVFGVITSNRNFSNQYNHYELLENLHEASNDEKIVGAILRINSPGGSAGASSELADEIYEFRQNKPIYVSISDCACSGAYLAASWSSKIFCSYMGMVGSIGVLMQIPNLKEISDKFGFSMKTIKSVERKDIGNPFREMTEEEEIFLKKLVDETHKNFVHSISMARGSTNGAINSNLDKITDGRIFNAEEAKELGLIDKVGTFYSTLKDLLLRLKLSENEIELEFDEKESLLDKIISKISLQNLLSSQSGLFLK